MSKEIGDGTPTSALENKQDAVSKPTSTMTSDQAANLIMAPYVTEKTFNQIERENKLAFIVAEKATKKQIVEAILILYEADIQEVNTTRTIRQESLCKVQSTRRGKGSCYKAGFSIMDQYFLVRFKSGIEGNV